MQNLIGPTLIEEINSEWSNDNLNLEVRNGENLRVDLILSAFHRIFPCLLHVLAPHVSESVTRLGEISSSKHCSNTLHLSAQRQDHYDDSSPIQSPSPSMSTVSCPEYPELQEKLHRLTMARDSLSLQVRRWLSHVRMCRGVWLSVVGICPVFVGAPNIWNVVGNAAVVFF